MTEPVVGFIGLGSQGGPMASAVLDAGYDLVAWARREQTLDPFRGRAVLASSPADLAQRCDIVLLCVRKDEDVIDVVLREDGILAGAGAGTVLVVHSTTHPTTCKDLEVRCRAVGVLLLDAPVSGGGSAAAQGSLLVMTGGDEVTFGRALPVLSAFGDPVVHLGPVGTGQMAKLVNNVMFTANLATAHDAVSLGRDVGLDPDALVRVLQHGSSRSFALDVYAGMRSGIGDPARTDPIASLLDKDVALAHQLAAESESDSGWIFAVANRILDVMRASSTGA
jgi:3-hydroxyisobutyrate dehydrogenase